jgi:hypothetical protein
MHSHRLQRLARLTTGAALVGASVLGGCKEEPTSVNAPEPTVHPNATAEPIHVNAPPTPTPPVSASASASASQPPVHVNAPPK